MLTFGTDGRLDVECMTPERYVIALAVDHWQRTKSVLLTLNIKPEHCSTPFDRACLEAVYNIDLRDGIVDFESVLDEIDGLGLAPVFRIVGGPRWYLAAVCNSLIVVSEQQIRYRAQKLLADGKRRQLLATTLALHQAVQANDEDRVKQLLRQMREEHI